MNTDWLKSPANLVMIGPTGVGKSHVAAAFCHDAVMKRKTNGFYDFIRSDGQTGQKPKNIYSLIDYYARVHVLCLDELGGM